jgi:hypothetical protein
MKMVSLRINLGRIINILFPILILGTMLMILIAGVIKNEILLRFIDIRFIIFTLLQLALPLLLINWGIRVRIKMHNNEIEKYPGHIIYWTMSVLPSIGIGYLYSILFARYAIILLPSLNYFVYIIGVISGISIGMMLFWGMVELYDIYKK